MQGLNDEERKQVLGEVLMDEFKAIREGIGNLPTKLEFNKLVARLDELSVDVKATKAAVTDLNQEHRQLHSRVTQLEQTA